MQVANQTIRGADRVVVRDGGAAKYVPSPLGLREMLLAGFDLTAPALRPLPGGQRSTGAPLQPGKIVAIGLNYRDHAREAGIEPPAEPLVFAKFPSAVIGPEKPKHNRIVAWIK